MIIRTCAIGDFVLNLPALAALQKIDPDARLTLVGNAAALELARKFVAVDAIYSIEQPPWSRLFYEPIPDLAFDQAVVWMKNPIVADNLRLSGVPNVIRRDPFPAFGHASDQLLRGLNLPRPDLPDLWNAATTGIVTGTASSNAFVELYRVAPDPSGFGEGMSFVASTVSNGAGNWTINLGAGLTKGGYTVGKLRVYDLRDVAASPSPRP